MKFTKEPGFKHTVVEPRYFVLRLDETEPEYAAGYRFAIRFLNNGVKVGLNSFSQVTTPTSRLQTTIFQLK